MANISGQISAYYLTRQQEREVCNWVRLVTNFGIGGTICLIGFVANLVAYIVLSKGRRAAPLATFLLRCLAVTDNFFLLAWSVNFSLRDLLRYLGHNSWTWRYCRLYTYPAIYIAQSATIWLTVLIGAARYVAVCKPHVARNGCTLSNLKAIVGVLYLFAISYNLPRFFELQVYEVNGTAWFKDTSLGANRVYRLVYWEIMYYLLSFGIPLVVMIVLNVRLTVAYRAVSARRRQLTSRSQQDDANITLVMIVVVAVFVLCQAPGRLAQIIWNYNFTHCRTLPFFLMECATLLELLNSSVNFLIYYVIRAQFRTHLVGMVRCTKTRSNGVSIQIVTSPPMVSNNERHSLKDFSSHMLGGGATSVTCRSEGAGSQSQEQRALLAHTQVFNDLPETAV